MAAVKAESVHGAADALRLTQSAVTKRLQALERRAGVALFDRGRFGIRPTQAGQLLYPEAKHVLAALAYAGAILDEHREIAGHALRLVASQTIGEFLLPRWLSAFRAGESRLQPPLRAQVTFANSPAVLTALREGTAEIGFVEGLDALEGFAAIEVAQDSMVVVVAADHPWAKRGRVAPTELGEEPYITREASSGTRAVAYDALNRLGVDLVPGDRNSEPPVDQASAERGRLLDPLAAGGGAGGARGNAALDPVGGGRSDAGAAGCA